MKTIWKYTFSMDSDIEEFEVPSAAYPLSVGNQGAKICLWMCVSDTNPLVKRKFQIVGTGRNMSDLSPSRYVGTVIMDSFVWHIFEKVDF